MKANVAIALADQAQQEIGERKDSDNPTQSAGRRMSVVFSEPPRPSRLAVRESPRFVPVTPAPDAPARPTRPIPAPAHVRQHTRHRHGSLAGGATVGNLLGGRN